ncbi:hypothetical protein [Lentibacillus salicampi]|uniref:LysM domain-containing protein n=1 Tax=Lentibacillus salicampi TaxID=175306 RepID=A0A4Y9AI64_9BACI|nr:hypothetical protein [Lentibacillus salicampi]TFJ94101.1 hypothetical protein E4U82_04610 [Lentibacillus salicampi]
MNSIKKLLIYIFAVLFLVSIYQDLTAGTPLNSNPNPQKQDNRTLEQETLTAIKVKVNEGDTVLSIVEKLNDQSNRPLDISQIQTDFKALNPHVEPLHIKSGTYYYFPLYN